MTTAQPTPTLTVPGARGACPFSPPPSYQEAAEEGPVVRFTLWDGSPCWMVTRHQEVRAVLGDRRFSADVTRPGFPFLTEGRREIAARSAQSFLRMDDPEHARLRRMLTADFMVKRVEALRPQVQRIVDDTLDRMIEGGAPADLVAQFALPVPSLVICRLLGVPYEDHEFFQDRSRIMLDTTVPAEAVRAAQRDLLGYLGRLAGEKEREPDDGILSRLVARGELDADQVAATAFLLLIAGHETTANMTSLSTLALLRDPAQLAALREDPSLIRGAVEELLRFLTIVHTGLPRVALEDVEIGGRTIPAGEGVLCMLSTANRDEGAFPGGDGLDVGRDARRHVAFGFGVHQCLGQPLARLELQIALETLLRRLPGLRLAIPFEQVPFRENMAVYGVHELPVAW